MSVGSESTEGGGNPMTCLNDLVPVGPLTARLGNVTAYLYLCMAEQPPVSEPSRPGENASDDRWREYHAAMIGYDRDMEAWYTPKEATESPVDPERVRMFLEGLGGLLVRLQELHDDPDGWTEENIQFEFYEAAKATFGTEKTQIREFFIYAYLLMTRTPNGPRWGQFVIMFGLDHFMEKLHYRFTEPLEA